MYWALLADTSHVVSSKTPEYVKESIQSQARADKSAPLQDMGFFRKLMENLGYNWDKGLIHKKAGCARRSRAMPDN